MLRIENVIWNAMHGHGLELGDEIIELSSYTLCVSMAVFVSTRALQNTMSYDS